MSAIAWTAIETAVQSWIAAGSGLAADHVIWTGQTAPTGQYIVLRFTAIEKRGRDQADRLDNVLAVAAQTITAVSTAADTLTITGHGLQTGDGPIRLTTTGALPAPLASATNYWAIAVDTATIKLAATFQNAVQGLPSAPAPVAIDLTAAGSGTHQLAGTSTTTRAGQEVLQRVRGPRAATLTLQCFGGTPTGPASALAVLHDALTSGELDSLATALGNAGIGIATVDPIQVIDDSSQPTLHAIATVHLNLASELVETSTYIEHATAVNQLTGASLQLA